MNQRIFFLVLFLFATTAFAGGDPPEPEIEPEPEVFVDSVRVDSIITIPIVTAEWLPSEYGAVTINTSELDSTVIFHADVFFDTLDSARGILLDIRAVWPGVHTADLSQTLFFKILIDSVPKGPLAILTNPRWPGTEEMATHAQHRPFTTFDYTGNLDSGKRTLKTCVQKFEKGGGKTIEDMDKLRELYPEGITPNIPNQPAEERK